MNNSGREALQPQTEETAQHNVTGMECRGDMRGLAGVPQAAAEVPEKYLRGHRDSRGKCGV